MTFATRKWIGALCALVTLIAVAGAIQLSLDRDHYFFYNDEQRAQWTYQSGPVALIVLFMMLEGAWMAYALLGPRPRALWLRCLIAWLLFAPWAFLVSLSAMHAPGYFHLHIFWTWAISLVLMLVAVIRGSLALFRRATARG